MSGDVSSTGNSTGPHLSMQHVPTEALEEIAHQRSRADIAEAQRDAAVARAETAEQAVQRVRELADAYARSTSGMFTGQLFARDIRAALDPAGPTDA